MSLLAQQFSKFDPLQIGGAENIGQFNSYSNKYSQFSTPAGIISEALNYIFPAAGLLLFVMIVWGGFEILSGAASSKSKDAGKQRITAAITGFILLFASYWIIQIVEIIFNVSIF
jgi:hypothetical protein